MALIYDDLAAENGSPDRAVLLSERTQLLACKALAVLQNRNQWEDMDDSTWDDVDGYVGEAYDEILTIAEGGSMAYIGAKSYRSTAFAVPANVWTPVPMNILQWSSLPTFYNPATPTKLTVPAELEGKYAISGGAWMNAAGGTGGVKLVRNGTISLAVGFEGGASATAFALAVEEELSAGDTIELQVYKPNATSLFLEGLVNFLALHRLEK